MQREIGEWGEASVRTLAGELAQCTARHALSVLKGGEKHAGGAQVDAHAAGQVGLLVASTARLPRKSAGGLSWAAAEAPLLLKVAHAASCTPYTARLLLAPGIA